LDSGSSDEASSSTSSFASEVLSHAHC